MRTNYVDTVIFSGKKLGIFADNKNLLGIRILSDEENISIYPNALTKETKHQLQEYFKGQKKTFSLPYVLPNPDTFYGKVYRHLLEVPFGEILTYKELAKRAGYNGAYRAVGSCMGKNPYIIVVPCHRIIASDYGLAGYGGGLDMKEKLLNLEGLSLSPKKKILID